MIRFCRYVTTENTIPYENLALEAHLMETVQEEEAVLYLWQNRHTVVIGRNQNAWKEVRVPELEKDGGHLVRRLSGGGAVYHDLGNLNFTFLVKDENYDVDRQTEVILQAVRSFGIQAQRTGRNDITVDGRKFSGNAFYKSKGSAYHHGTLLVNVDMDDLSRYLNVPAQKLTSKGVDSVRARVVNLQSLCGDVSVGKLKETLIASFADVYGCTPCELAQDRIDENSVAGQTKKFSSWDWIYGQPLPFTWEGEARFPWGGIQLQLSVEQGRVSACRVYSDAMDGELIGRIPGLLAGCVLKGETLGMALAPLEGASAEIYRDMCGFLCTQNF